MTSLTDSKAWRALEAHAADATKLDIAKLVDSETGRMDRLFIEAEGLVFDFSKHLASAQTFELLAALAEQQGVPAKLSAMMAGEKINNTENRAAWHTALRAPDAPKEVKDTLARIKTLSDSIRADKKIRDVVHIGIGGSDLGPRFVCDALAKAHDGPRIHFVANVDPDALDFVLKGLKPQETLVLVASKTFTTQETMLNFNVARAWLGDDRRIMALTENADAARKAGIADAHILPLFDWVGGRFSMWSSVGFPIVLAVGFPAFEKFLAGAHAADQRARNTPVARNIPVLMALLCVWYRNFIGCNAHAILPYAERLKLMPEWLQQLEMESGGKRVDRDGKVCAYATSPAILGGVGTSAQHAFFQMLHQGTDIIPCDFIGIGGGDKASQRARSLTANMLAQSRTLMLGGGHGPHEACPGNRPSTTVLLPVLDAYSLGFLLGTYEHKTVTEGFLWNLNSFDQFGVELGKSAAKELLAPLTNLTQNETLDKSTSKLIFHTFLGK